MAEKTISTRLLVRSDTSANWSSANPTLQNNELAFDTTTKKFKIGDGSTAWNSLDYINDIEIDATSLTKSQVHYIEGTGTSAGVWLGADSSITEYYTGLIVLYKIPIEGKSGGVTLQINSLGAKKCYYNATSSLTTHFPKGCVVLLVYDETLNSNAGGFRAEAQYAGSDVYVRQYYTATTVENTYPLLFRHATTSTTSYVNAYARFANELTYNASTGVLTSPKFSGDLIGNADTSTKATQDGNGNVITNTYAKLNGDNTFTGNNIFQGSTTILEGNIQTLYDIDGSSGQSGQVLTATENGTIRWETPSSGSYTYERLTGTGTLEEVNYVYFDKDSDEGSTNIANISSTRSILINFQLSTLFVYDDDMGIIEEYPLEQVEEHIYKVTISYADSSVVGLSITYTGSIYAHFVKKVESSSGGASSYPIIDLDDGGLSLFNIPSGTTTQAKIDAIVQAGGFYYGDKGYAPLIVQNEGDHILVLGSRSDYAEEGYSDAYQIVIDKETLSFETFYFTDVMISGEVYQDIVKRNQDNTFTGFNTFGGDGVEFATYVRFSGDIVDTHGNVGSQGQVLTATGNGDAEWQTPSNSGSSGGSYSALTSGKIIVQGASNTTNYTELYTNGNIKFLNLAFNVTSSEVAFIISIYDEEDIEMWTYECGPSVYDIRIVNNMLLIYEDGTLIEMSEIANNISYVEFGLEGTTSDSINVHYVINEWI